MNLPVDVSTLQAEGTLQVSKSRKLAVLLDTEELQALFTALGSFTIFDCSRPVTKQLALVEKEQFLQAYNLYVEGIKKGELIDEKQIAPYFSSVLTTSFDVLYAMALSEDRYLLKARRPIVQMKRHHFVFSEGFYSGVIGKESITWGIEFSYPQLYLDPKTASIGKVEKTPTFPNTALFHNLAYWIRHHTLATPFLYEGRRSNQPIRLGKNCFSWINQHPSLKLKRLYVATRENPPLPS